MIYIYENVKMNPSMCLDANEEKKINLADKMSQQVREHINTPEDLNSIPGTHTTEGQDQLRQMVLLTATCSGMSVLSYTQINVKKLMLIIKSRA